MGLEVFSRDVLPIITFLLTAAGLYFIWKQMRIATHTLEQNSSWNKIHATYNYFDLAENSRIERDLYEAGEKIGVKFSSSLSDEELGKLLADNYCFLYAKEFLNNFESLCAAYQIGALDKDLAFQMFSTRVVKEFTVLRPLINHLRTEFKDPAILIELQKTAIEWRKRLNQEKKAMEGILNSHGLSDNDVL